MNILDYAMMSYEVHKMMNEIEAVEIAMYIMIGRKIKWLPISRRI